MTTFVSFVFASVTFIQLCIAFQNMLLLEKSKSLAIGKTKFTLFALDVF